MISIYQGDDTGAGGRSISIDMPDIGARTGFTFGFELCGLVRSWAYRPGETFEVNFSADETGKMPLGVSYGVLYVENGGRRTLSGTIPVLVTDSVERVHGGTNTLPISVTVHALLPHVDMKALTKKSSDRDLRDLVNALLDAINKSSAKE